MSDIYIFPLHSQLALWIKNENTFQQTEKDRWQWTGVSTGSNQKMICDGQVHVQKAPEVWEHWWKCFSWAFFIIEYSFYYKLHYQHIDLREMCNWKQQPGLNWILNLRSSMCSQTFLIHFGSCTTPQISCMLICIRVHWSNQPTGKSAFDYDYKSDKHSLANQSANLWPFDHSRELTWFVPHLQSKKHRQTGTKAIIKGINQ